MRNWLALAKLHKVCNRSAGVCGLSGVPAGRVCPVGYVNMSETLASKFRSLGADSGDLELVLQAVKRHVRVAAGADIVRAGDPGRQPIVLLTGMTCSYKS